MSSRMPNRLSFLIFRSISEALSESPAVIINASTLLRENNIVAPPGAGPLLLSSRPTLALPWRPLRAQLRAQDGASLPMTGPTFRRTSPQRRHHALQGVRRLESRSPILSSSAAELPALLTNVAGRPAPQQSHRMGHCMFPCYARLCCLPADLSRPQADSLMYKGTEAWKSILKPRRLFLRVAVRGRSRAEYSP